MSIDNGDGADGNGDGADGNGAAGALAGAAGAAGGGDAAGGGAGSAGAADVWHTSMGEEAKAYATNKGWLDDNPVETMTRMQTSYHNLEKLVGGDKIGIPKAGDEGAWGELYKRLGRPDEPTGYDLAENVDEATGDFFRGAAHKAGLNPNQVSTIVNGWNEHVESLQNQKQADMAQASAEAMQALRTDWGADYDTRVTAGQRAAGMVADIIDADGMARLEDAIGTRAMMEMFAAFGKQAPEDGFVDSSGGENKQSVQSQIDALQNDRNFMDRYMAGDPGAVRQMGALYAKMT